jgi:ribose/xylose/arabinose/galactoside ABC-type transport system permease subunit
MLDYPVQTLNSFNLNRKLAQQRRRREEFMYNMGTGGAIGGATGSMVGITRGKPIPWTLGGMVVGAGLGSYYTKKGYRDRSRTKDWVEKYKNDRMY